MPPHGSGPSDPKVDLTINRAKAEEWARDQGQFCERCGKGSVIALFDDGFWGTTGQRRAFYGLVCPKWIADPKGERKKDHFGVAMLAHADPDTEDGSGALDYEHFE